MKNLKKIFLTYNKISKKIKDLFIYIILSQKYKRYLKKQHFANEKQQGEDLYIGYWKQLGHKVEPYSYRFFSHYMEASPAIVPESIGRSFIETRLNPESMIPFYEDKNMFPLICGKTHVPQTFLCRMNGGSLLDRNLKPISGSISEYLQETSSIILKPTIGSSSGRGVMLFVKKNNTFISVDSMTELTEEFLMEYSKDFVIQQTIKQHKDIAIFNPTSVNTLRIAVYRSWKDEDPHILASIMRVGSKGQYVDNAHAGGMFVGINPINGIVGNKLFDQYGNSSSSWNDLDYSVKRTIPCWDKVIEFACEVSKKIVHHRLIALDITVTEQGEPLLIEYNLRGFSYWLFMYTGQKPFGDYSDEIIDFCLQK
jgi:hypothetical protein